MEIKHKTLIAREVLTFLSIIIASIAICVAGGVLNQDKAFFFGLISLFVAYPTYLVIRVIVWSIKTLRLK
jgi:hypothetical protein